MFKIDHMGFFSVLHTTSGCLSGEKILGTSTFWDKSKNYRSVRVTGAQTLANSFLKFLKKTCLVIGLSDKTTFNSI